MERRRFSQTMASEWQTAFAVSHKMPWCALLTGVKKCNKSLENCKTFSSRPIPRPRLHDPRPRLSFLSSRRFEAKTLVSRTTSLEKKYSVGAELGDICGSRRCETHCSATEGQRNAEEARDEEVINQTLLDNVLFFADRSSSATCHM